MRKLKNRRAHYLTISMAVLALAPMVGACDTAVPGRAATPAADRSTPAAAVGRTNTVAAPRTGVVDSVLPMPVMLARFREGLPRPNALRSGVDSRDALVERVVVALQRSDTMAFEKLGVNRAEFAWLYFPTSINAFPPYELPPALAWFQLQEANRKGVLRALRELGGRALDYRGYTCADEPKVEDRNRLWTGCTVTLAVDGGPPTPIKLFSAVLERDARFAVLSYANDF